MKFIHTSDWHLGKKLKGFSLWEAQKKVLNQFIEKIKEIKPDVFILAGDIYDTTTPSKEVLDEFTGFLKKIKKFTKHIIIIPGNHDNNAIVGQYHSLLDVADIHIFKNLDENFNELQIEGVFFYPIPYLPSYVLKNFLQEKEPLQETHPSSEDKTTEIYKVLLDAIAERQPGKIQIPVLHLGISDNQNLQEDSDERGNVPVFPSSLFEKFSYVALGHYHKFLAYKNKIVYPSSLLQYRDTEEARKGFVLGNIENQEVSYEFIPFDLPVEIMEIKGTLDNQNNLKLQEEPPKEKEILGYFKIKNLAEGTDIKKIIEEKYPNVRVMEVKNAEGETFAGEYKVKNLQELDLKQELLEFIKTRSNQEETPILQNLLQELFNEIEL